MYLELLQFLFSVFCLLFLCGYWASDILLPRHLGKAFLYVIPFTGVSLLLVLSHAMGFLGIGVDTYIWPVIVLLCVLTIYSAKSKREEHGGFTKEHAIVGVIFIFIMAINSLPVLRSGYLSTHGTNMDSTYYCIYADHLQRHGIGASNAPSPIYRGIVNMGMWVEAGADRNPKFGSYLFHSMTDVLSGLDSHKTFTLLTAVFHSLMAVSTFFLARFIIGLSGFPSVLAAVMLALQGDIYFLSDGFLPHLMSLSLLPAAIGTTIYFLEYPSLRSCLFGSLITIGCILGAFRSFAFYIPPVAIFLMSKLMGKDVMKKHIVLYGLFIVLVLCVGGMLMTNGLEILPGLFRGVVRGTLRMGPGNVAWFIPLSEVLGMSNHLQNPPFLMTLYDFQRSAWFISLSQWYSVVPIAMIFIACIMKPWRTRLIFLGAPFIFYILYFRLRPHGDSAFLSGDTYAFFKVSVSAVPILSVVLAQGMTFMSGLRLRPLRLLFLFLSAGYGILVVLSLVTLLHTPFMKGTVVVPDKEMMKFVDSVKNIIPSKTHIFLKGFFPFRTYGPRFLWFSLLLRDYDVTASWEAIEELNLPGLTLNTAIRTTAGAERYTIIESGSSVEWPSLVLFSSPRYTLLESR